MSAHGLRIWIHERHVPLWQWLHEISLLIKQVKSEIKVGLIGRLEQSGGKQCYRVQMLSDGILNSWFPVENVLCCVVLYCVVLCCIVLYCIILYCIVLYLFFSKQGFSV